MPGRDVCHIVAAVWQFSNSCGCNLGICIGAFISADKDIVQVILGSPRGSAASRRLVPAVARDVDRRIQWLRSMRLFQDKATLRPGTLPKTSTARSGNKASSGAGRKAPRGSCKPSPSTPFGLSNRWMFPPRLYGSLVSWHPKSRPVRLLGLAQPPCVLWRGGGTVEGLFQEVMRGLYVLTGALTLGARSSRQTSTIRPTSAHGELLVVGKGLLILLCDAAYLFVFNDSLLPPSQPPHDEQHLPIELRPLT